MGSPPPQPVLAHRKVTHTCVVKKCLMSALNPHLLDYQRERFTDSVDKYTEMASRMVRRASLMLLYYVVRLQESGREVPDFENLKDGDWKTWLRIGLEEFGHEMPSEDVVEYFHEVRDWLGTSLGCSWYDDERKGKVPMFFDRVLGHAAIAFKTAFHNTQNINFFAKLKRVCKCVAMAHRTVKGYELFVALRNDAVPESWPDAIRSFVAEARRIMELEKGQVLWEDTEIPFVSKFDLHWWMQQILADLGQRRMMLSPVFQVSRMHVRLDATTLYMLAWRTMEPPPPVLSGGKAPNKTSHPEARSRKDATQAYKLQRAAECEAVERYKEQLADFKAKFPSYAALGKEKPSDPQKEMDESADLHPFKMTRRPKDMSDVDWKAERARQKRAHEARLCAREAERTTPAFQARVKAYEAYEKRVQAFGATLFRPFDDKSPKSGWAASSSVATDGVSISITYEKTVLVPITALQDTRGRTPISARVDEEREPCDDYTTQSPTIVDDVLVLGVDPGRTFLVTVVCIGADGKKKIWRLSRGQYYTEGGINGENKRQAARYAPLAPQFTRLAEGGGCLRASSSVEIRRYLAWYARMESDWWAVALRRAESRSKMKRYIAKRSVIDKFFATLHRDARMLLSPGQRLEVAYGSAGLNMKSTGRGEAAVPTCSTYKACQQEFGEHNVSPEWEANTTKVCMETGLDYEKVYKWHDAMGKEFLCHTTSKRPPPVAAADISVTQDAKRHEDLKAVRRRGGRGASLSPETGKWKWADSKQKRNQKHDEKLRHPVCRGLLFCTERRMFLDRDGASGYAIARLRCLKLRGLRRPAAFCPSRTPTQIRGSSEGSAATGVAAVR